MDQKDREELKEFEKGIVRETKKWMTRATLFRWLIGIIASVIVTGGVFISSVIAFDNRYAKSDDLVQGLNRIERKTETSTKRGVLDMQIQIESQRSQQLEDKIFEREATGDASSYSQALIRRYRRQLQESGDKIRALEHQRRLYD